MKLKIFALVFLFSTITDGRKQPFFRTYECVQGHRCERSPRPLEPSRASGLGLSQHASLQACRLVCSTAAGLWPIPTGHITTSSRYVTVHPRNFHFLNVNDLEENARYFLTDAVNLFLKDIRSACKNDCQPVDRKVIVHLKVESSSLDLNWDTDEGYDLEISSAADGLSVIITAQTVFGARHGLETLSQLVASTPSLNGTLDQYQQPQDQQQLVMLDAAALNDKPVFRHRGLLLDTARNFVPVPDILRTIDALAAVKMNVLHWHATDSQSFPLEIKSTPFMAAYGAYGPDQVYSVENMEHIVKYAKSRGVRVIMEIDSPSHAGAGWDWGASEGLGNLAVCVNQQPWRDYCIQPPCGQLNPVNVNTYTVLEKIYKQLLQTFGRDGMIHLGGDELFINCWNATEEVVAGMAKLNLGRSTEDFLKIWSDMHKSQLNMLNQDNDGSTDKVILWSSLLTSPEFIEKYLSNSSFIVQTWVEADRDLNEKLLDLGYQLIISTKDAWYLDHGFWGVTKYHTWRDAYNNKIPQNPGVLGGEACMWGEYIFGSTLDSRVWPRTAAVAERLWSDPARISTAYAEPRLQAQIERLQRRRVFPDAISPEWCNQHEGQCL